MIVNRKVLQDLSEKVKDVDVTKMSLSEKESLLMEYIVSLEIARGNIGLN